MIDRAVLEISKSAVEHNFKLFIKDKPAALKYAVMAKNKGCGLGLQMVSEMAVKYGAEYLSVANLEELIPILGYKSKFLLVGQRHRSELEFLAKNDIEIQVQTHDIAKEFAIAAAKLGKVAKVHVKVDTGLSRFGFRWEQAAADIEKIGRINNLKIAAVMTHFAMSDELDKSFVNLQYQRFTEVLNGLKAKPDMIHCCNTGGYLDLPAFHHDLCRVGILFSGNYPSKVCRRIKHDNQELISVQTVRTRIAYIKTLEIGDMVGYGMHFKAKRKTRLAILPMGYGDGYPRLRNKGEALIAGQRVSIIGGVAMDSIMIDITDCPMAEVDSDVVILGKQGKDEITATEIADNIGGVNYQVLVAWQPRLKISYI